MRHIIVHMEFEVPDRITADMIAVKITNATDEVDEWLNSEMKNGEDYTFDIDCYEKTK